MADEVFRAPVLVDQPLSDKDLELLSFLKRKFATKLTEKHSYCPAKVLTKNNIRCVLDQDVRLRSAFERRQETLRKGFFSPINRPYKPVGTLYSDHGDLFSGWLSTEDQERLKMHCDKKYWKKSCFTASTFAQEKVVKGNAIQEEQRQPQTAAVEKWTRNGLLELKHYLRELSNMKYALNAGRPLICCLKEQVPAWYHCDRAMSADKGAAKPVPLFINQKALDPKELEPLERMQCRNQELLAEKLQWIYMVLCGLNHMKNRDLKSTVPLNSRYVNTITMDPDKANILLRQTQSSFKRGSSGCQRLASLMPEHNTALDVCETFSSPNDAAECKMTAARTTGHMPGYTEPWRRSGQRERTEGQDRGTGQRDPDRETGDVAPWLASLLADNSSLEKKPQQPKDQINILDRFKMEFFDAKNLLNAQMETLVFEKKKNQEERMKTVLNALMTSKNKTCLSTLLFSLRNKFKEPKSTTDVWFTLLKKEANEVGGDNYKKFESILQKISYFNNFTNKNVPYSKEKFCLLVVSLPANQLLRPAVQEALLFLTENVLQLHAWQLKGLYLHLNLPFYTLHTSNSSSCSKRGLHHADHSSVYCHP